MNKRLVILTLCLAFLGFMAFAQEAPVYFAKNGHVLANPDSAEYYRVIDSRGGDSFRFKEFHKDSTWVEGVAKGDINNPVYINDLTFHYKSGRIAVVQKYQNGRLLKTTGYYPNGVLIHVIQQIDTWPLSLVVYDADSSGHIHIINGNGSRKESDSLQSYIKESFTIEGPYKNGMKDGLWKGSDDRGFIFEEKYESGKFISGTTKTADGKKYHYTHPFEYPVSERDIKKTENQIKTDLTNSSDGSDLKFQPGHILRLSYLINDKGFLQEIYGYKAKGLEPVKLELKQDVQRFSPAKLRGVPISFQMLWNYSRTWFTKNANLYYFNNTVVIREPFNTDVYLNGTYTRP